LSSKIEFAILIDESFVNITNDEELTPINNKSVLSLINDFEDSKWRDGKLSKYYDLGRVIEEQFIQSWDKIEQFYSSEADGMLNIPYKFEILNLITQLRQKGFDKTLRADQSNTRLLLSRSRPGDLMIGQSMMFVFHSDGLEFFPESGSEKKLSSPRIKLTPQIERLLKELEAKDIIYTPLY
jgi:hypothetical protein